MTNEMKNAKVKRENTNRINDTRSPIYWEGKCEIEDSQFCGLSEDGYYHDISVCDDCPYVKAKVAEKNHSVTLKDHFDPKSEVFVLRDEDDGFFGYIVDGEPRICSNEHNCLTRNCRQELDEGGSACPNYMEDAEVVFGLKDFHGEGEYLIHGKKYNLKKI